ncbi:MAG TPA: GldG family protein [Candidatus Udaeobacter sp.]|nr:GldG family protein [Candidatus Udaeobacter sp.]
MAGKIQQPRTRRKMKIGRVRIGLNVVVQIVLILFLAAMVNSLAFKHYKRWDFSRDEKYTLSDKTKRFLDTLKGKMRITVFFSPNTPITTDVQDLVTEYQYAGKGKIDVERIDPERSPSRTKEFFDKYKVVTDESLLVLDYDRRNKTVKASEMADVDQSGMAVGEGPRVASFKGEQAITSAMIDLVEGKKKTLGYVTGHKEPAISAPTSPISLLKQFIENENIKFQELNLLDQPAIPADLNAVMIVGPQYDFSEREMQGLRDFWDKQGRVLVFVDPAANTPRLRAFLDEIGVKVNDDRLMVFVRTGIQELALTRDVQAHFLADSPITKRLADVRSIFVGGTASLTLDPNRGRAINIQLQPLIQTEKGYFAETDYNTDNQAKLQADAQKAGDVPLTIGASAEKGGSADARVQVNSSRLVAVSNATFVQDTAIMQDQAALDFVSGAVNWLLSREQMIGIAPKIPKPLTFSLDPEGLRRLRWLLLVLMPLIPAAIGTVVWWQRRV